MASTIGFPLINGFFYDYSSLNLSIPGVPLLQSLAFKSISYKNTRKHGKAFGASAVPIARGRGQVEAEGAVEFYKAADAALMATLAAAFPTQGSFEWTTTWTISYGDYGMPVTTDTLPGVQFMESANDPKEGTDLLVVKRTLSIFPYVMENGIAPIFGPSGTPIFTV